MSLLSLDINSMYPHQINVNLTVKPYTLLCSSPDSFGTLWYEIEVGVKSLQRWIEDQSEDMWCDGTYTWGRKTSGIPYLVHESLYTYITLKWQ
jgi:hypothetical protein